ncbi:MAG: hypothetical protein Q8N17_26005 [Burkholderiaceae bacterium]|nr:hypothetical protein [Burkholderiaceae bacterium]
MALTREDFNSPTWARLMQHMGARREELRSLLEAVEMDRPQTDHARTLMLRGRIQEVKELLALAEKSAPAEQGRRPTAPLNLT